VSILSRRLSLALSACLLTGAAVGAGVVLEENATHAPLAAETVGAAARPAVSLPSLRTTTQIVSRFITRRATTIKPKPRLQHVTASFVVSTFNALGASHTAGGGAHRRYASGTTRARYAAELANAHNMSVIGFQELQSPQLGAFLNATGHRYAAYPGFSLGQLNTDNSLLWRTSEWTMVRAFAMRIPYFHGSIRLMPAVLLQNRQTGLKAWFMNVHNPADTHGNAQRFRNAAMSREAATVNTLVAQDDVPVIFTGDFNERDLAYCRFTSIGMISASGVGSGCNPPHPTDVDWIFAKGSVTFTDYVAALSPLVRRTTDHQLIVAVAHLSGTRRR
jgi:hypothetical protein